MDKEPLSVLEETMLNHRFQEQSAIINEYETVISSLKEELHNCRAEQTKLRLEIDVLKSESRNASDEVKRNWMEHHSDTCGQAHINREMVTNLEKRITILQMEKESVFQLWQMALKAIDILEEELKTVHVREKTSRFYQEQINDLKEAYSDAIKVLEIKLTGAKENFFQSQLTEKSNKEKIDELNKEKDELLQKVKDGEQKEALHQAVKESLREKLNCLKDELEATKRQKLSLEEKLNNTQNFLSLMKNQDNEAKSKVAEAVALIEAVVEEKQKFAQENVKLQSRLADISMEFKSTLDQELLEKSKKYILEIKNLKIELRDRKNLQEKMAKSNELLKNNLIRANSKIQNLEKVVQVKSKTHLHDEKIRDLEHQITILEDKLLTSNEKLKRSQLQSSKDVEDQAREACEQSRDIREKCLNLERKLARTVIDKEAINSSLQTLQASFEKEIQKREHEKSMLEIKLKDLQESVKKTENVGDGNKVLNLMKTSNLQEQIYEKELSNNIHALQANYERHTKELSQHVEIHRQLSQKWKEEATTQLSKFERKTKELHKRIHILQKQNEDLTKELLFYQKHLINLNAQVTKPCFNSEETR